MMNINTLRECETTTHCKLHTEIVRIEEDDNDEDADDDTFSNQITAAPTINSEIAPLSPSSPILSSPSFNKRPSSSSHYPDQFNAECFKINTNQSKDQNVIEKPSASSINLHVKNLHILSPTPFKAINFAKSMLSNSTSYSLTSSSSSSSSSSSAASSQSSSLSCISVSSQSKEPSAKPNAWQHINNSCSHKKITAAKNLYHSDDDEQDDCCEEEENENMCIQRRFGKGNMGVVTAAADQHKSNHVVKQSYKFEDHSCNYPSQQLYQDRLGNNSQQISKGQSIRTKLFSQQNCMITHFTLEDNNNNNTNNVIKNNNYANNTTTLTNNTNTQSYCGSKFFHTNTPYYSRSAPQPFISSNEIDSDDNIGLACSIERSSAQNPQSKDEEFLNLNLSSFTEETFEQFKESLLQELLDKSF